MSARRRSAPRARRIPISALPALALALMVLLVWALAAPIVGPTLLPAPGAVVRAFGELAATGDLLPAAAVTMRAAGLGILLALVLALPIAWLISHSRWAAAALEPYVAASQAVPAIALAPLLVLWLGYGLTPIAVLCALLVFFPIVVTTSLGLRGLDPEIVDAAHLDGAGGAALLRYIEAPLALPSALAGLRAGVTLSMTGAVVGEFVMGGRGLGQLLLAQRDRVDTSALVATLALLSGIAVAGYALVRVLEGRARARAG